MTGDEERDLRGRAAIYLDARMGKPVGFWQEGLDGLWRKIIPGILGFRKKPSVLAMLIVLSRFVLFIATVGFPVVVRKVTSGTSIQAKDPMSFAIEIASRWDRIDSWLLVVAMVIAGAPKVLEVWSRRKYREPQQKSALLLANALNDSPFAASKANGKVNVKIQSAIDHALEALLVDLRELIEDSAVEPLTDVTLLEFCGQNGSMIRVRGRSDISERSQNEVPVESWRFLAYYVAQRGNWFAEHNFLSGKNPFAKKRITVRGNKDVSYKSVLYLPITKSTSGENGVPVDHCLGVICVHSAHPYRFWQWGDHKLDYGKFGNVAYNKALPYISLINRLLASSARPLIVEKR